MLQQYERPWKLAALFLKQLGSANRTYSHSGKQIVEPVWRRGVEGKHTATGAVCQVEENLGVPPRRPVGDVMQHEQLDAPSPHLVGFDATASREPA
jgi:hypothetical protein